MDSGSVSAVPTSGMTASWGKGGYGGKPWRFPSVRGAARPEPSGERRPLLFGLETGRLDDRPPLVDFRLVVRVQRFGRQLLARRNFLSELGEACADGRIVQRFDDRRVQFHD